MPMTENEMLIAGCLPTDPLEGTERVTYNELLAHRLRREAPATIDQEVKRLARAIQGELEEVWGRGMAALVIKELLVSVIELAIMEQRETEQ